MRTRRKSKYPNLTAEIVRHGDKYDDLSKLLGISNPTISKKMVGDHDWTMGEIEKLCDRYNKNYYELFKGE